MLRVPGVQYRNGGINEFVQIDDLPDTCPQCHRPGVQVFLSGAWFASEDETTVVLAMRCPSHRCNGVYLAFYKPYEMNSTSRPDTGMSCRLSMCRPLKPTPYSTDAIVANLSPRFQEIASQAKAAEQQSLLDVCGPGYRKALEFLVKDFLIKHKFKDDSAKQDSVRKMALANAIASYIDHPQTKALAARCAWLGNDETHYERVHGDHDLQDLKNLLNLTALYIAAELHAEQYTTALQKPTVSEKP